ncbi:MAG: hypothetical protein HYV60_04750 [Planctomycetia bacterium]|nr:hypothetical protein [Planctomycetia bacterium]
MSECLIYLNLLKSTFDSPCRTDASSVHFVADGRGVRPTPVAALPPYGPREMVVFNRLADLQEAVANNPEIVHERVAKIYASSARSGELPRAIFETKRL